MFPSVSPPTAAIPYPQGEYYTGVGYKGVGCIARELPKSTLICASTPASTIEGINAEVAKGQWEFQIFGKFPHAPPTRCGLRVTS